MMWLRLKRILNKYLDFKIHKLKRNQFNEKMLGEEESKKIILQEKENIS